MSDTTDGMSTDGTSDTTPTEALQLADQDPVATDSAATATLAPAAASSGSHTRTILEVIGGVVAAGLIVVAGAVGFAVGHATADDDDRWSMTSDSRGLQDGPDAGAPMGPGQGQGREDGQGQLPGQGRGHEGGRGRG